MRVFKRTLKGWEIVERDAVPWCEVCGEQEEVMVETDAGTFCHTHSPIKDKHGKDFYRLD